MVDELNKLADSQVFILKALATYRFLTVKQMLKLDYQISRTQLYSKLKPLKAGAKPLVKEIDFGSVPGKGRLDVIFYLSPHGARVLQELNLVSSEQINFPKRVNAFYNDYEHRLSSIDFHIAVRNWINKNDISLDLFETYYDNGKKGPKGKALQKTTVTLQDKNIVPDAVFSFSTPDNIKRLCCFELHNGDSAKRILDQVEVYCQALQGRQIEDNYKYAHSARVLIVFENEKCLHKAQDLFQKRADLTAYRFNFFLKTIDDIEQGDFKSNWQTFHNNQLISLFSDS